MDEMNFLRPSIEQANQNFRPQYFETNESLVFSRKDQITIYSVLLISIVIIGVALYKKQQKESNTTD